MGTALAADGTGVRVFGAEPAGADDCARGLREGTRRADVDARTIADGLRTPVGVLNFPVIQEKVEAVITVTDEVCAFVHIAAGIRTSGYSPGSGVRSCAHGIFWDRRSSRPCGCCGNG